MTFHIKDLRLAAGIGGFWVQDQPAIQTGAQRDGFFYRGTPVTPGFESIKEPSQAYCVVLKLDNGVSALGDCVTVVNPGYAGRPAPLRHQDMKAVEAVLQTAFCGKSFSTFRAAAQMLDTLELPGDTARPVAYGVSQALLSAAAKARDLTMAEVVAEEFGTTVNRKGLEFAVVCEGDWHANVDKAIVRRVAMFPHCGLQWKEDLDRLPDYVEWMVERLGQLGSPDYKPDIHIDFHSVLGRELNNDIDAVCEFLFDITKRAGEYRVYFEDPMLSESTEHALANMKTLRGRFDEAGATCRLIADEWANSPGSVEQFVTDQGVHAVQIKMPDNGNLLNTIEAIQMCHRNGVLPYLGGSGNDTDISTRSAVHLGLALNTWRVLVRPGKGLDEGLMIMTNEMARTLVSVEAS